MITHLHQAKITLYCLPFAGGNALSYRDFQSHVSKEIQIMPLDLPGHGKRIKEPLLTEIETIVSDLFAQIKTDIKHQPYAIYGHSMGSLTGYLLSKHILSSGYPTPRHLFFSGKNGPSKKSDKPDKHRLAKKDFLDNINELGGMPREILEHAELMDFFEPILRADFKAIETYFYQATSPMNIPITLLQGLTDQEVSESGLQAWQEETLQPISLKKFKGGHFFIFDHLPEMGQLFSHILRN
jgi:surfactin synthase thioesterase subunit